MTISERQQQIVDEFDRLPTWEEKYKRLIALGKELPALPQEFYKDEYKVKGCQSQVWLNAKLSEQKHVIFEADSDAMIVKGLAALLIRIYSDSPPQEILTASPEFLKKLGLETHLSPSRSNGLYSMLRQMLYYATAFQALVARG